MTILIEFVVAASFPSLRVSKQAWSPYTTTSEAQALQVGN